MNRHGLVAGATGTGKTRTLQGLAEQLAANGVAGVRRRHQGRPLGRRDAGRGATRSCWRAPRASGRTGSRGIRPGRVLRARRHRQGRAGPRDRRRVRPAAAEQGARPQRDAGVEPRARLPLRRRRTGSRSLDLSDLRAVLQLPHERRGQGRARRTSAGCRRRPPASSCASSSRSPTAGADVFFGEPEFDTRGVPARRHPTVAASSACSRCPASPTSRRSSRRSSCTCSPSSSTTCPRSATSTSRSSCSSSTRRTCCSRTRRRTSSQQVVQTVRLIRSKGVGVFFVTQTPKDVPADVLAQLGSRVQHALRAFTPDDAKALRATVGDLPEVGLRPRARCCTSSAPARRSSRS